MRKATKRNLIAVLALSAVCSFGFAGVEMTASADEVQNALTARTEDVFFDGAGVYLGNVESGVDKSGIRFCVVAKKSVVESKTVGAFLAFADEMGADTELTNEDRYASKKNEVLSTNTDKWQVSDKYTVEGDEYMYTYVYIYDFTEDAYNRVININPYVLENTTYAYVGTAGRSMAQVALDANANGFDASKYIKTYGVNYYNGDEKMEYSTSAKYGSTLIAPTVTQEKFVGWYADKELTTEFDFTQTVKGTVNVYAKFNTQQTIAGNYADFDLSLTSNYTFIAPASIVQKVTINDTALNFTQNGTTVTLKNSELKAIGVGEKRAVIETTDTVYSTKVTLATRIIKNETTFNAFKADTANDTTGTYYVLAKSLSLSKTNYNMNFSGTFDGRGFTISSDSHGNTVNGFFFKKLNKGGVLKNTAFIFKDLQKNMGQYNSIVSENYGCIENIYVKVVKVNFFKDAAYTNTLMGAFFGKDAYGGTTKNSILDVDDVYTDNHGIVAMNSVDLKAGATCDASVYVVGSARTGNGYFLFEGSLQQTGADVNSTRDANGTLAKTATWDTSIWDTSGDWPVFKSAKTFIAGLGIKK